VPSPKLFKVSRANHELVNQLAESRRRFVVCITNENGAGFPPLLEALIGALRNLMDDSARIEYAWIDFGTVRDFAESRHLRRTTEALDLHEIS
jgi:hypothetical protein